jgi:hypothetical protein
MLDCRRTSSVAIDHGLRSTCLRHLCYVFAALTILLVATKASAQQSSFADTQLYDAVLDHLFIHNATQRRIAELELRYTYCSASEMQLLIRTNTNEFQVESWDLPPGKPNVWDQLGSLATPGLTPERAAALISLRHESLTVPKNTPLGSLIEQANSLTIAVTPDQTTTLDGMEYRLSVLSLAKDLSITLRKPEYADARDTKNAVIGWMIRVRAEFEKMRGTEPCAR